MYGNNQFFVGPYPMLFSIIYILYMFFCVFRQNMLDESQFILEERIVISR